MRSLLLVAALALGAATRAGLPLRRQRGEWVMKPQSLFAVAVVALSIQGCSLALMAPIEPTDLSEVQAGATRADVEAVLGDSIAQLATANGTVEIYEYDRGDFAPISSTNPMEYLKKSQFIVEPLAAIFLLIERSNSADEQRGELSITYGPDDKVVRIENARQRDLRELQEELSVVRVGATREQIEAVLGEPDESESGNGATIHVYRHQRGNARKVIYVTYGPDGSVTRAETAMQRYEQRQREAKEPREEKKRRDMADLLAKAQCGDARAQFDLGYRYRFGNGVPEDFARAYFWFGIAYTGGVGPPPREQPYLSGRHTPEQIAEAERLMADWEPKDCGNGDAVNAAAN